MIENNIDLENREKGLTIDSLARNKDIVRSKFNFDLDITRSIIDLAIEKVRKTNIENNPRVFITQQEIKPLAKASEIKPGIVKLMYTIKEDILRNNYFRKFVPNIGIQGIETVIVKEIGVTEDMFQDLFIYFRKSHFDDFRTTNYYYLQSLKHLNNARKKTKQLGLLYEILQPYAKFKEEKTTLEEFEKENEKIYYYNRLKEDLLIEKNQYQQPKLLTLRLKRLCSAINKLNNDITLKITRTIKKDNRTIGCAFVSQLREPKRPRIEKNVQKKPISIRQQLTNWGVRKDTIDIWLANIDKKTINDAIKKTINRPKPKDKSQKSNAGGYIAHILGDGKQPQLQTQIKKHEIINCLKVFGLQPDDIKKAQDDLKKYNGALLAVVNKCLREQAKEALGTDDMRQFFINELSDVVDDLMDEK
ncbi:hypothetical protein [uncultured Gammaproteobacteria bacterium]|jgi:predicted transcriptional regulator|nr:hypothetical protein [uncultured Gammaproteobacteria bacterium]CAC9526040.1 hypothetical protein [uncultured Gammaproteobacteria bacterium]CAC9527804.1 hypothetical protein [uncultured Gammaproteobacteria bacterium]CAC9533282.1 hypothetical protein [uncultured Gammaproteobacteria bacterium]CAC9540256.1 hypothetical protein [uncultured Gammaproteobacteria bacterium]